MGGDDATTGFDQLLAGRHGAHQRVLADAGRQIGFLTRHRHHGGELGDGSDGSVDGAFSGKQLLSDLVGSEATFLEHGTFLLVPARHKRRPGVGSSFRTTTVRKR